MEALLERLQPAHGIARSNALMAAVRRSIACFSVVNSSPTITGALSPSWGSWRSASARATQWNMLRASVNRPRISARSGFGVGSGRDGLTDFRVRIDFDLAMIAYLCY